MNELKAAIIGYGRRAQSHLKMIAVETRPQLVAIADPNDGWRGRNTAKWIVEDYADYWQMLDITQPDIAAIATIPRHFKAIASDCLKRNLYTSVKKSPGMDAAEIRVMVVVAAKSGGKTIVSCNRCYFPKILALWCLIAARPGVRSVTV